MRMLYEVCRMNFATLTAVAVGDTAGTAKRIFILTDVVVPLLKSPLVSSLAFSVLRIFCDAAFVSFDGYMRKSATFANFANAITSR